MASQIPEDFGSEWDKSDVVLHTLDSDGKELHANKTFLAMFSPYFDAMFSGKFKEAEEKNISLECDYAAFKEILRIVHQVNRDFSAIDGQKRYDSEMLEKLYVTADMLDFPLVRKLCEAQMVNHASVEMATVALSLGLHDLLMAVLAKLPGYQIFQFFYDKKSPALGSRIIFSKRDLSFIYEEIHPETLSRKSDVAKEPRRLNLEEISEELKDPRIDLTHKWPMSDVALLTKNSQGRLLYSIKRDLASYSNYFQRMFFGKDRELLQLRENMETEEEVPIEVEYATMKQILRIVHNCDMNFSRRGYTLFHPVLLYDMFLTSSVDNLDIPFIRKFCCGNLLQQEGSIALEVAVKLRISNLKQLVSRLPGEDLRVWVFSEDGDVSYFRDGKEVVITAGSQEQVLSCEDVWCMVMRLAETFFCRQEDSLLQLPTTPDYSSAPRFAYT